MKKQLFPLEKNEFILSLVSNWTKVKEDQFIDNLMKIANVNTTDEFNDDSDDAIMLIHDICEEIQIVSQAKKQLDHPKNLSTNEQIDIENTIDTHCNKANRLYNKFLNNHVSQ